LKKSKNEPEKDVDQEYLHKKLGVGGLAGGEER